MGSMLSTPIVFPIGDGLEVSDASKTDGFWSTEDGTGSCDGSVSDDGLIFEGYELASTGNTSDDTFTEGDGRSLASKIDSGDGDSLTAELGPSRGTLLGDALSSALASSAIVRPGSGEENSGTNGVSFALLTPPIGDELGSDDKMGLTNCDGVVFIDDSGLIGALSWGEASNKDDGLTLADGMGSADPLLSGKYELEAVGVTVFTAGLSSLNGASPSSDGITSAELTEITGTLCAAGD